MVNKKQNKKIDLTDLSTYPNQQYMDYNNQANDNQKVYDSQRDAKKVKKSKFDVSMFFIIFLSCLILIFVILIIYSIVMMCI